MYLGKKWWYDFYRTWFMSWVLILCGMVEALWGIGQIYGYLSVKHAMFPLTGSFYNPGPYGGFLAMAFPVCLWEVLNHYCNRGKGLAYPFHASFAESHLSILLIGEAVCGTS